MTVTSIIPLDKKRSRIYIDNEFAFVLYKGELFKYRISENQDISEAVYRELTEVVLVKRAKLRAMNLLTKRDYSEKALRDKLLQGEYPDDIVEQAMNYVKSFGYIDDQRYAQMYYRTYQNSKPLGKIREELLKKGISKELTENLVNEVVNSSNDENEAFFERESREETELAMAKQLLQKKHYDCQNADYKEKQRMYGFLMRKGFSSEIVFKALSFSEDEGYM